MLSGRIDIEKQGAGDEDVDRGSAVFMDWASKVDLDAGIAVLLDKEANTLGDMPARHLVALAATGAFEVLQSYADAFAHGDRLGFVPYITTEHIAVALEFSKNRASQPGWSPRSPRLRL